VSLITPGVGSSRVSPHARQRSCTVQPPVGPGLGTLTLAVRTDPQDGQVGRAPKSRRPESDGSGGWGSGGRAAVWVDGGGFRAGFWWRWCQSRMA
jgi:hypothetical protein